MKQSLVIHVKLVYIWQVADGLSVINATYIHDMEITT